MDELNVIGCLWVWEENSDYVLCDGDWDLLPTLYQQDDIRYEYNQKNQSWSTVSCTIFSAMWMVSDLMNYEFSLDELREVDELSYEKWRTRGKGWYVKSAVDLVRKRWNEKHRDLGMIAYYRIEKNSPMIDEILKKWYTINWNMKPTTAYWWDYSEDAIVDWNNFWTQTNGHAIDLIWDWVRKVKDSYKGRKTFDWSKDTNRYELKHPISEMTNYWPYYYVYTKVQEDNLEEIKRLNEIKAKCNLLIDHLGELWNLVNDQSLRAELHHTANRCRSKIQDANIQLKKYI